MKYSNHLKVYLEEHKISEFFKINPKLERLIDNSKKLVCKLNIEVACRLAKIIDLQEAIASIFNWVPSAIQLYSIADGCVVVTFNLLSLVGDTVFTRDKRLTLNEVKQIQSLSVMWMEYDGCRIAGFEKDIFDEASSVSGN